MKSPKKPRAKKTTSPKKSKRRQEKKRLLRSLFSKKALITAGVVVMILIFIASVTVILFHLETTETIDEYDDIGYTTEYKDDDNLELGEIATEQNGQKGRKRNLYKVSKRLISGEVTSKEFVDSEVVVKPTKEIVKRGTKRWQYMYCSDGSYRYYTDEQFQNKNIGFTNKGPDYCAENGQGQKTELASAPPPEKPATTYRSTSTSYAPVYYSYTSDYSTNSYAASEPFESSLDNTSSSAISTAEDKEKARASAQNICQSKASSARQSVLRQINAGGGGGGSSASSAAQQAYDSTYQSCMRSYGF